MDRIGSRAFGGLASVPMNGRVRITDVSPRDGLQNEAVMVAASDKVALVRALCASGVDEVEVTSFVSPKWVPQLADASEVLYACAPFKPASVEFSVLVPNDKGLDAALAVNDRCTAQIRGRLIDKVSVFTAASETFSRKNTNATISETLARFEPVISHARGAGLRVRGYVSCVIACPFEGPIDPRAVADVSSRLLDLGIDELDLGDTIGAATPESTRRMLDGVGEALAGRLDFTSRSGPASAHTATVLHLHDTFGRAASCALEALDRGIRWFDGAVAGLGGCPYASTPGTRAPGNISTEGLVLAIQNAGYQTGVNSKRLAEAARVARSIVGREASTESPAP